MRKKYVEFTYEIIELQAKDVITSSDGFVSGEDLVEGSDPYIHDFYD